MITGIVCKCKCTKEFLIKISEPNNIDRETIRIYNNIHCPKCNEKIKQENDNGNS